MFPPPRPAVPFRTRPGSVSLSALCAGRTFRTVSVGLPLLLLGFCACAPHIADMSLVREEMSRGNYEAAHKLLGKGDEDDVLHLLEKGLLSHYAGLPEESNSVFERAEILSEDLYTKSISREAAAFLTSDLILEYSGTDMERAMINFYRALNYMDLGSPDDVLVECRKINQKLVFLRDQHEGDRSYYDDPFLQYVTGLLYEWGGEVNDAFISYREAHRLYPDFTEKYGVAPPVTLPCDLKRTALILGMYDAADEERWGREDNADESANECIQAPGNGEVFLILELGFVAHMDEVVLHIPIFKDETDLAESYDEDFFLSLADRAAGYDAGGRELAYLLSVAVPHYVYTQPEIRLGRLTVGEIRADAVKAQDLSAIALQRLNERLPGILAKTAARAVTKYLAKKGAKGKWGKGAGFLVDVFGSAMEHADTRSWLSLPSEIHVARLSIPAGTHETTLELIDRTGECIGTVDFGEIRVGEGDIAFLHYRVSP